MKIGIINLPMDANYGGTLQRYAMCKVLTNMGHTVEYIPFDMDFNIPRGLVAMKRYSYRFLKKYLFKCPVEIYIEKELKREHEIQIGQIQEFTKKWIPSHFRHYSQFQSLEILNKYKFDAFLVGSDQVWRTSKGKDISNYFLCFASDKVKKIAYSVSFGNNGVGYDNGQINRYGKFVAEFNAISFRESNGIDLFDKFRWHLPHQSDITLDPTLLLDKEDYKKIINSSSTKSHEGLFAYMLDNTPEKIHFLHAFAQRLNMPYYQISSISPNIGLHGMKPIQNPSIEQWLRNFEDANFVITDSFHGTMFSIIFNKPFYVIGNEKRGIERYSPILEKLGLRNRFISEKDLCNGCLSLGVNEINWEVVNRVLAEEKKKSVDFLKMSLII